MAFWFPEWFCFGWIYSRVACRGNNFVFDSDYSGQESTEVKLDNNILGIIIFV